MKKEMIIVSVILILIIILNIACDKFTNSSVQSMNEKINELIDTAYIEKNNDLEENIKIVNDKNKELDNLWSKYNPKLSLYMEHDELEKVDSSLVGISNYIEVADYDEAIVEMHNCQFLLNHIKEKEVIKITNLF